MANQQDIRESIQAYLLDTLSEAEHAQVEESLAQDPLWQALMEEEIDALALLDSVESVDPPTGLAERTLARLDDAEEEATIRFWQPWIRNLAWTLPVLLICLGLLVSVSNRTRESKKYVNTSNYLKQMGLVLKMYANESKGEMYPPLAPYEDLWMFDVSTLYPEYISDLTILVSPFLPDHDELVDEMRLLEQSEEKDWRRITEIAARGFSYTGWIFEKEEDLIDLVSQRQQLASAQYNADLETPEGATIPRLREGIERFLITDINNPAGSATPQSRIPILFESLEALQNKTSRTGAHTLYMDGHVEFHALNENPLSTPSVLEHLLPKD